MTALLTAIVAGFSGLWTQGALVVDGPGISLYLRLSTGYVETLGRIPYWYPDMWSGAPPWALAPSFPALVLVPLASMTSADVAVKIAILVLQVAGGVGTYVVARSLWGRTPACFVAALVYTLHPLVIANGALGGSEPASGVLAATPWLVWAIRRGIRGDGTRYLVVGGLTAAFAILHQAELAYALAILCLLLVLGELRRTQGTPARSSAGQVVGRAGVVLAVALGAIAHWLLPFLSIGRSFVLSPPALVRGELFNGIAATVSQEIGIFFQRTGGLNGTVSFNTPDLLPDFFYLGWVCVALSMVTLLLLAHRDGELVLATVLLVALFGVWMSTGAVPLAASGPALRNQWPALVLVGVAAGLAVGGFLRRMHFGRTHGIVTIGAAILLLGFPFVTPFLSLQAVVPLLATLRIPRFYVVAPLGLALGAAYPITLLSRWAAVHRPSSRIAWPSLLAAAVVVAFAIDIAPSHSYYRVHPPPANGAYDRMAAELATAGGNARMSARYVDPRTVTELLNAGRYMSVGWPHPLAGIHLWRITGEPYVGPPGYWEAANGLSSTQFLAVELSNDTGKSTESLSRILLVRNPRTLPIVRSYDQTVIVADGALSPLLATSLAARNVGVVTGTPADAASFGGMPTAIVPSRLPCERESVSGLGPLAGEVALACGLDPWLGAFFEGATLETLVSSQELGGIHESLANGLRGMAVWLSGGRPDGVELTLHEAGSDGLTLGPELSRGLAVGTDEYGLTTFTFDPIPDSAGRRFAFIISCVSCPSELKTTLITGPTRSHHPGNLIINGRQDVDRQVAFVPIYDRLPPATTPGTAMTAQRRGPGRWRVETDGQHAALLVVAETYFPGWEATVDGHKVPVFEADGAFVGVPLPPGHHVVDIEYHRPAAAIVGRMVTFATLFGLAFLWWRGGRSGRRSPRDRGSGPAGDTLQVGAPPVEPDWEAALHPDERRPGPPVTAGEGHAANETRLCCRVSTTSSPASANSSRSVGARNRECTPTPSQ